MCFNFCKTTDTFYNDLSVGITTTSTFSSGKNNSMIKSLRSQVKILENQNVAYDIGSYRSAPPGLRIWGGPTINPNDIKLLLPWLQWAFEDTFKLVKKGN